MANFRLKDHDQGKDYVGEHAADYPVQGCEFADPRKIEQDGQHRQAHEHGDGAGAANHHQDLINEQGDQQDVECDPCALRPGCDDWRHLRSIVMQRIR